MHCPSCMKSSAVVSKQEVVTTSAAGEPPADDTLGQMGAPHGIEARHILG